MEQRMKKMWLLTKVQLGNTFYQNIISKKINNSKKKKSSVLYIAILFFILLLAGCSFVYSYAIGTSLKMIGRLALLPELMMAVTSVITIITTIYKVKGTVFGFKDYDVVMSLPVRTSDIVASRLLLLYLINIVFTLLIMIPNMIAYGILAQASPMFYVINLLIIVFIPLVPMVIATIIGTIIAVIAASFRHSNIISIIIIFSLLAGIMIFSFTADNSKQMLGEMSAAITKQVDGIYPLARMYRSAVCDYSLFSIIVFLIVSISAFIIFSWIVGMKFKMINTIMSASHTKSNYKMGKLEQTSPFTALYQKELRRYFSSTLYVMNTAVGIVMMTMGAIATLFMSKEKIAQVLEMPGISQYIGSAAAIFVSMCVAMSFITACSISLEGKNLWIVKASPISAKTIFDSKIAVSLTVTLPAVLLDGIIIAIGMKLTWEESLILLAMPTAYAFLTAIVGLIINLKLPNLNWTTEVMVIKQSAASMIAALGGLVVVAIPIVLIFVLSKVNALIISGLTTLFVAIISIIMYQYLKTRGAKILSSL